MFNAILDQELTFSTVLTYLYANSSSNMWVLARNRIEGVNIEDLEYGTELESEFESGEDSWTDSENESFSPLKSDDESEVSSEDIEI